jgi:primosomal protein N' (replication factor Y)
MDRDTVDSEASHRATLDSVRSGETDVLVGTQMIAKGHDLPMVTLVGVIDGDVGLHLPDFRSSERVFQLLTQVAGRAGRGENPGSVIIQTRQPKHSSITCTAQRNFFAFASLELQSRRDLLYPPFSSLIRIVVSSQDKEAASHTIGQISDLIRNSLKNGQLAIKTLGPSPAPFERVRGKWRFHCLFKAKNRADLNKALVMLRAIQIKPRGVRLTWDVDPADML